ncbi:MAG: phosphonate C-P lyase system protein PhnG [Alphaproteobacteria bacterium]|nr:phosphonate C-P lyase system protein PhnG [Alphaproteobacteria bacterium]
MPDASDLHSSAPPPQRRRWMAVLAKASVTELERAWASLQDRPGYRFLRPPECGLALVRGRIGGSGDPFNLGEMTLTRCAVVLDTDGATGFGYVAGRDARHAELAAAFDALMQCATRADAASAIDALGAAQRARRREAAQAAAATKVEFFTLARE